MINANVRQMNMHVLSGCLQSIESAHRWGPAGARKDPDRSAWQPQYQTAHATFMLTFYLSGFGLLVALLRCPWPLCDVLWPHTGVSPLTLSLHSKRAQPHAASLSFNTCQHATNSSVGEGERNMICFGKRHMEKMTSLWKEKRLCLCVWLWECGGDNYTKSHLDLGFADNNNRFLFLILFLLIKILQYFFI